MDKRKEIYLKYVSANDGIKYTEDIYILLPFY